MEMEGMITHAPGHCALFGGDGGLICLTFNAKVHDVVAANGAIIYDDIPSPQSDGIPFFDLKSEIDSYYQNMALGEVNWYE